MARFCIRFTNRAGEYELLYFEDQHAAVLMFKLLSEGEYRPEWVNPYGGAE